LITGDFGETHMDRQALNKSARAKRAGFGFGDARCKAQAYQAVLLRFAPCSPSQTKEALIRKGWMKRRLNLNIRGCNCICPSGGKCYAFGSVDALESSGVVCLRE
jgi:hypothetical protein